MTKLNNNSILENLNEDLELYYVLSSDGLEKGIIIGENEDGCEIESCMGTVSIVEWEDGEISECCSCGMKDIDENTQQIV